MDPRYEFANSDLVTTLVFYLIPSVFRKLSKFRSLPTKEIRWDLATEPLASLEVVP